MVHEILGRFFTQEASKNFQNKKMISCSTFKIVGKSTSYNNLSKIRRQTAEFEEKSIFFADATRVGMAGLKIGIN